MLVVDRNVFTQLQADQTGIDFMELSANLIRAHHLQCGSTPSILDSDATSKGLSPISLGFSPPSYEDIFGEKNVDLPPSYSELSLSFRHRHNDLSGINDINENEHHSHNGINSVTKISRGNRAIESGEEEVEESICELTPNEYNSEMNSQIKFQIQFGGNTSTVPSINSTEIRNNLQENDDQERTTKINTEETFDKKTENCQCCVMTYENEKNGSDKCVCCKSLVTGPNGHHVGNSNSNVYTERSESDEVLRISVDKEINTQDGACCSHGNSIRNLNATGLYSVNSNVRSNKVGDRFDNQTATYHAKLATDKKSDSTAIKIQKCKDIKESSL